MASVGLEALMPSERQHRANIYMGQPLIPLPPNMLSVETKACSVFQCKKSFYMSKFFPSSRIRDMLFL